MVSSIRVSKPLMESVRSYVFDIVGMAFAGATIYVGVTRGVVAPDFTVFLSVAAVYLGLKAPTQP